MRQFWRGKRVLLTGHTGFKGAWLALLLERLGAEVTGFALVPEAGPSAFVALRPAITSRMRSATEAAPAGSVSGTTTTNSSPPKRPSWS